MFPIRVLAATTTFILAAVFSVAIVLPMEPASAAGLSDPSVLTKQNGGLTVTEDGAVIENLEIVGTLRIEANNVLVRNVWVYGSEFWSVYVASGSARFENVEIGHPSYLGSRGIGGNNIVATSLDIHHVEDGIKLGSNSTYSDIWVHDLASPSSSPHTDAVQIEGGSTNSTVKNSSLSSTGSQGLGNAAVIIKSIGGIPSNITFSNNYMNGGNYTVYVREGTNGAPTNISFVNNRFGTSSRYGLTSFDVPVTWENNTWADTGEIIDPAGNVISQDTTTTTRPPTTTTIASPTTTTSMIASPTTTSAIASPTTTTSMIASPTTTTSMIAATSSTTTGERAVGFASEQADSGAGPNSAASSAVMVVGGILVVLSALYLAGIYVLRRRERR